MESVSLVSPTDAITILAWTTTMAKTVIKEAPVASSKSKAKAKGNARKKVSNTMITSLDDVYTKTGKQIDADTNRIDAVEAVDIKCEIYFNAKDVAQKHPKEKLVTEAGIMYEGQGKVAAAIINKYGVVQGGLMLKAYGDSLPN